MGAHILLAALLITDIGSWAEQPPPTLSRGAGAAARGVESDPSENWEALWFWFATCGGPLMTLEVSLDRDLLYQTIVPLCHARRSDPESQGQDAKISFSFSSSRSIEWHGYRDEADTTPANEPLHIDFWEAGADPDNLLIGVTVRGSEEIHMNTLHVASPSERRDSEIAKGLVVSTYPAEATERISRTSKAIGNEEPTPRQWALATTEKMSWEDAHSACEELEIAGADDWRLPSIEELTLHSETVSPDLEALLSDRRVSAWACNPLQQPHPDSGRRQPKDAVRLEGARRKVEQRLCELEGREDCSLALTPMPPRWQYAFEPQWPHSSQLINGSPLCVRGPSVDCGPDDSSAFRCWTAVHSDGWTMDPHPDVVIEGIRYDGSRVGLGRSNDYGHFCMAEEVARGLAVIMACDGAGCGAISPGEPSRSAPLLVDEPVLENGASKTRFCFFLRESGTGTPVCGARVEGVLETGTVVQLGETGPAGSRCVRRKKLDQLAVLLACISGTCRALDRSQLTASKKVVLSLPADYSSGADAKGACRATREHGNQRWNQLIRPDTPDL